MRSKVWGIPSAYFPKKSCNMQEYGSAAEEPEEEPSTSDGSKVEPTVNAYADSVPHVREGML